VETASDRALLNDNQQFVILSVAKDLCTLPVEATGMRLLGDVHSS